MARIISGEVGAADRRRQECRLYIARGSGSDLVEATRLSPWRTRAGLAMARIISGEVGAADRRRQECRLYVGRGGGDSRGDTLVALEDALGLAMARIISGEVGAADR
ncbi:MAG: hypothetical protein R3F11_29210 [Verrucomicrobiales bacterium]